jgi:hypothetical protein
MEITINATAITPVNRKNIKRDNQKVKFYIDNSFRDNDFVVMYLLDGVINEKDIHINIEKKELEKVLQFLVDDRNNMNGMKFRRLHALEQAARMLLDNCDSGKVAFVDSCKALKNALEV